MTELNFITLNHRGIDHSGKTFGWLTAIGPVSRNQRGDIKWICICECGTEKIAYASLLRRNSISSCGCRTRRIISKARTIHGMAGTNIYGIWKSMRSRCGNPKCREYHFYGARGIKVCDRWRDSFENFYADMGDKPDGLSLDRIDNSGDYRKSNCRWTDWKTQMNNTRKNVFLEFMGQSLTVAQWSRRVGINPCAIHKRLKRGWSVKRTLTEPLHG